MFLIKGPITFQKGTIPEKMKEHISKNGIKTPFENLKTTVDIPWLKLKTGKGLETPEKVSRK